MLLVKNMHRGNDASGVALSQADGSIDVFKDDSTPWQFVKSKEWLEFMEEKLKPDTWAAMVHARAATGGNPRENKNNHPLIAGCCAAIHNGVIRNDDYLFKDMKLDRHAETDSDIIRAIADEHGLTPKAVDIMSRISGGVASCIFDPRKPKQLMLMRSGNPICLASTEDMLFFASEKNTLHVALKPFFSRFNIWFQANRPDVGFGTFPDHTAWLIGERGLEWHGKFDSFGSGKYNEPIRKVFDGYEGRQKEFDRKAGKDNSKAEMKDAWCPKCKEIVAMDKDGEVTRYYHTFCKTYLVEVPESEKVKA